MWAAVFARFMSLKTLLNILNMDCESMPIQILPLLEKHTLLGQCPSKGQTPPSEGLVTWGTAALIIGWLTGFFGLFGLQPEAWLQKAGHMWTPFRVTGGNISAGPQCSSGPWRKFLGDVPMCKAHVPMDVTSSGNDQGRDQDKMAECARWGWGGQAMICSPARTRT